MLTCKLQGGIGNQMFQIAATYALALRNNDTTGFDFQLCHTPMQGNTSYTYSKNILKNVTNVLNINTKKHYNEEKFSYSELPYASNLCLNGYFQSEKYFEDYKDKVIDLFYLKGGNEIVIDSLLSTARKLNRKPITSIHIRRGDYVKNSDFHNVLDVEYYKKAMEIIGDSVFIFISDDLEWVKENFKGDNFIYSPFKSDVDDLTLMTLCDNNIIGNSSFSWWGAYLNRFESKQVIAPKKWFGPKGPQDTQDLFPDNWIVID